MTEHLYLKDIVQTYDKIEVGHFMDAVDKATPQKTSIILQDHDTGEILSENHNKILITGSLLNACYAFGISSNYEDVPTYNRALGLDHTLDPATEPDNDNIVCLFCVDDSGCGVTSTEVYEVNYTDRIKPSSILPFRYVDADNDLDEDLRKYYYGKKTFTDGSNKIAYYFKTFDTTPQLHLRYTDGTQINMEEIYTVDTSQMADCFIETRLRINRLDFRDYFEEVLGWEKARISSVSLCWAWYRMFADGKDIYGEDIFYKFFQTIRPYTKLNFPLNWLVDLTKAIDIIYRIYY